MWQCDLCESAITPHIMNSWESQEYLRHDVSTPCHGIIEYTLKCTDNCSCPMLKVAPIHRPPRSQLHGIKHWNQDPQRHVLPSASNSACPTAGHSEYPFGSCLVSTMHIVQGDKSELSSARELPHTGGNAIQLSNNPLVQASTSAGSTN